MVPEQQTIVYPSNSVIFVGNFPTPDAEAVLTLS
jgi:hypothetical protein